MLSPSLVRLLAVICAVTVANLYYAQPLLDVIAKQFNASQTSAGFIITATQLGYAAGLLLIVPLGDILRRRPLLIILLGIDAVALVASAIAPNIQIFNTLAVLIGLSSVAIMIVVPYAVTLAKQEERSHVLGILMGGVLLGILLSRTLAGGLAALMDWRAVYFSASGFMVVAAIVLWRSLPASVPELQIGFGAQMRGIIGIVRTQSVLRWRSLIGAFAFAAFSCFWTTATFLLSDPPYNFSQFQIGLFALVGAAGAATTIAGGRLLDARRQMRWHITVGTLILLVISFGFIGWGAKLFAWLVIGALLMDACIQAIHVTNQSVIYDLLPKARSRLTTVYMTTFFIGGALGATAGSHAYHQWGWTGACAIAAVFSLFGLLCSAAAMRYERIH